jgi:hypothetical protein
MRVVPALLLLVAGCAAPLPHGGGGRGQWTTRDADVDAGDEDAGDEDAGDEDAGVPLCVKMPENPVCNVE